MSLLEDMAEQLPGSRLTPLARGGARLVFEVDGCWLSARCRDAPLLEVFIRTLDLPDFTLGIDRDIEASDEELGALWLDGPSHEAAAIGRASGYRFKVERGEVIVLRGDEDDARRLARVVRAGGVLAARPHRIAAAWLEVARGLGGTTTTDRWDLAGDFAVIVDRGAVEVRIDNLGGPLRTRVRATRLAATDAGDALGPVAHLLAAARPDETTVHTGEVALLWRGLVMDPARLGPAVEICARIAAPSIAAIGPYR